MKAIKGKHAKENKVSKQVQAEPVAAIAKNEAKEIVKTKGFNKHYFLGAFSFIIALLILINQTIVFYEVTAYRFFEKFKLVHVLEIMKDMSLLGFVFYAPIAIVLSAVSLIKKPAKNKIAISALVLGFLIYIELFSFFQGFIGQLRK